MPWHKTKTMKLLSTSVSFLLFPVFCVFAQQNDNSRWISSEKEGTVLRKEKKVQPNLPKGQTGTGINLVDLFRGEQLFSVTGFFDDSVSAIGSPAFKMGGSRQFFMGKNYRKEWKTSIRVPVIDLATEKGGLTPLKKGGGKQTRSLKLEGPDGKEYTLRSIRKYVTDEALPPELRGTEAAKDLVSDGISASYPYAAVSITRLSEAIKIPHGNPKIVFIPDDPKLGEFRKEFANSLALFEERLPDSVQKGYDTDEVAGKLKEDNDNDVDQVALLKVRLLDMYIMDLDRHEGQWTWGDYDNGKGKTFYPIAKDRDQAFYISEGLLPSIAHWPWIAPQVQGFRAKAININRFNFAARNLDRFFLNQLSQEDWQKATNDLLAQMTDSVIEQALHDQPKEIKDISANKIIRTLKDRRQYFAAESIRYYKFISRYVDVTGSDKKELFDVTRNPDGSVVLQIFKITKEGEQSRKMYERKFDPAVTKEIRLYGMGGDDKFLIHGDGNDIKIRMVGGDGEDNFDNSSSSHPVKNIAYDLKSENNKTTGNIKSKISNDTAVNSYQRIYYKYDQTIPFVSANYNSDDGLFLGASLKLIRHGFRKDPYKTLHQFSVNHSLSTNAYSFRYYSEFIGVFGQHSDLLFDADLKAPDNTTNFFGYGNASVFDKTKPGKFRYYRARYSLSDISLAIRKNFSPSVKMAIGPTFEFYSLDKEDNENRFIINTASNGLDPATLFSKRSYAGGILTLDIDTRKNKVLSLQGVKWLTSLRVLSGLNDASKNLTQLKSDLSFYLPLGKSFTLAARFGGGNNFGGFEFYQAQYLGGTENLRGYRKDRFAGRSIAYNNIEMRIRLLDFKTYLFPGSLGLLFFNDVGRVWVKNDTVDGWKSGYGGGFWFAPLKRFVITACYTVSKEDKLPLITLGWQF